MSAQHTPGPWECVDTPDYAEIHPVAGRLHSAVALVGREADATLIAAAPDLLAAVESARDLIDRLCSQFPDADDCFNGVWASYRDDFDAAIAKARGTP